MKIESWDQLFEKVKNNKSKIAVAAANDIETLSVVAQAEKKGLAEFILIGDENRIRDLAHTNALTINSETVHEPDTGKAVNAAVDMVADNVADTLMKGMIHSSVFLKAVLNKEKPLHIGKRVTQVSVIEKKEGGFLFITDCAITVEPDLQTKKEVLDNAVSLVNKLGYENPKVAVLASLETVNPAMPDTVDAAILSKMSDRGQIKGCIVDGPLAFDNAISEHAAKHKGINSKVAGHADIILVPNLTVGNALTKAISHFGGNAIAAATIGTKVPVVFTSRSESINGKMLSIALASYLAK